MEEIVLTDEERAALQDLEKWYVRPDTNSVISSGVSSQVEHDTS